jgi:hypothetical protein
MGCQLLQSTSLPKSVPCHVHSPRLILECLKDCIPRLRHSWLVITGYNYNTCTAQHSTAACSGLRCDPLLSFGSSPLSGERRDPSLETVPDIASLHNIGLMPNITQATITQAQSRRSAWHRTAATLHLQTLSLTGPVRMCSYLELQLRCTPMQTGVHVVILHWATPTISSEPVCSSKTCILCEELSVCGSHQLCPEGTATDASLHTRLDCGLPVLACRLPQQTT